MLKALSGIMSICCITLFVITAVYVSGASAVSVGEKAPNFILKDVSGTDVSLDRYRGKIVFINFWATWCPSCKYELRHLNDLQDRHKDIVVLAININKDKSDCGKFLSKNPSNVTILLDPEGAAAQAFKGRSMPTSYILGKDGTVRHIHFGFNEDRDPALWDKEISEIKGGRL